MLSKTTPDVTWGNGFLHLAITCHPQATRRLNYPLRGTLWTMTGLATGLEIGSETGLETGLETGSEAEKQGWKQAWKQVWK
jgi:hypothetical protein